MLTSNIKIGRYVGSAALIALALGLFVMVIGYSTQSTAAPGITWNPGAINQEIGDGQSVAIQATFTATGDLSNVYLRVVPELQSLVKVTPTSLLSVAKDQSVTITITVAAPTTTLPGITTGTIQLRDSTGTVARPLPVTVAVTWPKATIGGQYSFVYPTLGVSSHTETEVAPDGSVAVKVVTTEQEPFLQYTVGLLPNAPKLPLLQWFAQQVDQSGSILAGGGYELTTLPNGVQVLIVTGEIPDAHLDCCGPVADMYAISPSGATVIVVLTSQEHSFGELGSPNELRQLYLELLSSISAP